MNNKVLEKIKKNYKSQLSENDKYFLENVYSKSISEYVKRLKQIGFFNEKLVLDFGCGFGQWAFALAELNVKVIGYDYDTTRINICNDLLKEKKTGNISFTSNLEEIKKTNFDLIFSYSVIQNTKFKESLDFLFSKLNKKGRIYFTLADIGWYIYYLMERKSSTFNKIKWFSNSMKNSLNYYLNEEINLEELGDIIVPKNIIINFLKNYNFNEVLVDGEGQIQIISDFKGQSFFESSYKGIDSIYEVYCKK